MFIVIEGIDGAGCETQAQLVLKKLADKNKKTFFVKYPHYDTPVGEMIKKFLYQNSCLSPQEQFLIYSLQFVFDRKTIEENMKKGIVVADRYFTSTLCFQTLEGVDEEKQLRFSEDFGIIKPDLVFYLDVKPETAARRKFGEDKVLNFREKDLEFMKKTYKKYDDLVKRQVWAKWARINGEPQPEVIADEIVQQILTCHE
jgi:dTMP kinase